MHAQIVQYEMTMKIILLTSGLSLYIFHNQACSSHSRSAFAAGKVDEDLLQLVLLVHLRNDSMVIITDTL